MRSIYDRQPRLTGNRFLGPNIPLNTPTGIISIILQAVAAILVAALVGWISIMMWAIVTAKPL